jgi:outer membrane biosynthesis protein TonB
VRARAAIVATLFLSGCSSDRAGAAARPDCSAFGGSWRNPVFGASPAADAGPFNTANISFVGSTRHLPFPAYPDAALECNASGAATIQFRISPDGSASDFMVVEWRGSEVFAASILDYLKQPGIHFAVAPGKDYRPGAAFRLHTNFAPAQNMH